MIYDDDADLTLLDGKTVAIIGYGSQGHAHALNLDDSGVDVVVGLREDSALRREGARGRARGAAGRRGREPRRPRHDPASRRAPPRGLGASSRDGIADGNMLLFGHGFSIHYGEVAPPPGVDVALVAPKGPGHLVRRQFTEGTGVPGLIAVEQDATGNARALALAYAKGIGCTPRRRDRDDLQGRDRDRPVRRAGGALRRRLGARPGRLRDARRGRLRPRDGLLRVPPRAQADRRPDVREGPRGDALLDLQHRRVRRLHARQARDHRRDPRQHAPDPRRDPVRATSRASGSPRTAPARRTSSACAPSRPTPRSSTSARSCARTWTGSSRRSRRRRRVLAYVFWHRPREGADIGAYESAQLAFHRSLAGNAARGMRSSSCFRVAQVPWLQVADGQPASAAPADYEDWYLVDDFAALGVLNEAAVGRGHRTSHDARRPRRRRGRGRASTAWSRASRGRARAGAARRRPGSPSRPGRPARDRRAARRRHGPHEREPVAAPARVRPGARVLPAGARGAGRRGRGDGCRRDGPRSRSRARRCSSG